MKILEKYKEYSESIAEEVRIVVASLDNPIRQAILVLLNRNNELSFSEIRKELGLDKTKLNFHLKDLFSSALIDHYYRHELGNPKYSYYSLTRLGRRVLTNLVKAFIPPFPIVDHVEPTSRLTAYSLHYYYQKNIPEEVFYSLEKGEKEVMITTGPSGSEAIDFRLATQRSDMGRYLETAQ